MTMADQEQLRVTGVKSFLGQAGDGHTKIAQIYVKPSNHRPDAVEAREVPESWKVPVIDLQKLSHGNPGREEAMQEMDRACREWGMFQVVNHGVPQEVVARYKDLGKAIFSMPSQELRETLKGDPSLHPSTGQFTVAFSSHTTETLDWRDVVIHMFPENFQSDTRPFPAKPPGYKEALFRYREEVGDLMRSILGAVAENLGLVNPDIKALFSAEDCPYVLNMNYYPACPQPELTLGITCHTDNTFLTVLLQDDVSGLQVKHEGMWVAVDPLPDALVINLGDSMHALTNAAYQSAEHRSVVNRDSPRISFAAFLRPKSDLLITPLPGLVTPERPALYRDYLFGEYLSIFLSTGLQGGRAILSRFLRHGEAAPQA